MSEQCPDCKGTGRACDLSPEGFEWECPSCNGGGLKLPDLKNVAIRPMPIRFGVGFCSDEAIDGLERVRHEQVGGYHNYHFTYESWRWPSPMVLPPSYKFDAFSPNLNKYLHVGHLRNLALAASLQRIFDQSEFVAMLGRAIGYEEAAEQGLNVWMNFAAYNPKIYYDDEICKQADIQGVPGTGEQEGCIVWGDPPVIIKRSDGRPTYEMHDLAFAKLVKPDYYITGNEQKEHFQRIGLGDKHMPMGLVLDANTGKKMKSRDGNAFSAAEAMNMVKAKLSPTPNYEGLAWNILSWNFLHCGRVKDVKFDVEEWIKPESPGLYVTYTFARIRKAIKNAIAAGTWNPSQGKLTGKDLSLVGFSSYFVYYRNLAVQRFDPAPLAQFAQSLAQQISSLYVAENIANGRPEFQWAINRANEVLGTTMQLIGMFPLTEV